MLHSLKIDRERLPPAVAMLITHATSRAGVCVALLCLLACLRGCIFVAWPHSHFDSDQAVIGLMANDLAHGRAFPFYLYGSQYLFVVSAWVCAPLFAIFGPSAPLLKLPLLAFNVLAVCMLWIGLRRERLGIWETTLCVSAFALPCVVASSRLVEQGGGNIEPFVFILAAFFLRERPVWLGLTCGVAYLNREFSVIGFVALLLMEVLQLRVLKRWKPILISAAVFASTVKLGRWIGEHGANFTGGPAVMGEPSMENLHALLELQAPTLLGSLPTALRSYNIASELSTGRPWLGFAFVGWLCLTLGLAWRFRRAEYDGMATYLVLVALGQAAAYVLASPTAFDQMLVRYTLLVLLLPVGLAALAFRRPWLRIPTAALLVTMLAGNLKDNVSLIREYVQNRPSNPHRILARDLIKRGVKLAEADYWVAYHVSFLSRERVIVAPPGPGRMQRYADALAQHPSETYLISDKECPQGEHVANWFVCPPRAK